MRYSISLFVFTEGGGRGGERFIVGQKAFFLRTLSPLQDKQTGKNENHVRSCVSFLSFLLHHVMSNTSSVGQRQDLPHFWEMHKYGFPSPNHR